MLIVVVRRPFVVIHVKKEVPMWLSDTRVYLCSSPSTLFLPSNVARCITFASPWLPSFLNSSPRSFAT